MTGCMQLQFVQLHCSKRLGPTPKCTTHVNFGNFKTAFIQGDCVTAHTTKQAITEQATNCSGTPRGACACNCGTIKASTQLNTTYYRKAFNFQA